MEIRSVTGRFWMWIQPAPQAWRELFFCPSWLKHNGKIHGADGYVECKRGGQVGEILHTLRKNLFRTE